jgi:hypothetical protein
MEVTSPAVTLNARDVRFGDQLGLQHLSIECSEFRLSVPIGSGPSSAQAVVEALINEAELNRLIGGRQEAGLRDLAISLMTGKLRITGRYEVMGPIAVPFALIAVPEIVGGVSVRLDIRDLSVVGAALPGFSAQMIGERINARLGEVLNVARLGVPVRLTGLRLEPGRLAVTAEVAFELRPAPSATPAIADTP